MCFSREFSYNGCDFCVHPNVYVPAEDTFLIAKHLDVEESDYVLDMGTGCGVLGVLAAKKAKKVVAVDINPHAIRCAQRNAEKNGVKKKIDFIQGALFSPFRTKDRFNLILFNPPYLPSKPREESSWLGKAWSGGANGRKVIDIFVKGVRNFLAPKGRILFVHSSLSGIDKTLQLVGEMNLEAIVVSKAMFPFETIVLLKLNPQPPIRPNTNTD